jgi:hypothetical protein
MRGFSFQRRHGEGVVMFPRMLSVEIRNPVDAEQHRFAIEANEAVRFFSAASTISG